MKTTKRNVTIAATLTAFLAAAGITGVSVNAEDREGPFPVVRVVDGDTARVDVHGEERTLRYIGLDTPETVKRGTPVQCYGPEATKEAKALLEGEDVYLIYDESQGRADVYQRDLVYLELEDGTDFTEHMLREGFGTEYLFKKDYDRRPEYLAAEKDAQDAGAGLWGACQK